MNGFGAAAGMAGTLFGLGLQDKRQKGQNAENRNLMGIQYRNQRNLNQQGSDLQYKMWEKTNYPAQMKMLKEAGLNAGLIYGGQGGGGSTTGSQGGGSAASGSASAPMDIGGAVSSGMMSSQIELNKAQTEKVKAEAEKISGVDTSESVGRLGKIVEETKSEKLKQILLEAQKITETQKSGLTLQQAVKTAEEVSMLSRSNEIGDETKNTVIEQIGMDLIKSKTENKELQNRIYQSWIKTGSKSISELGNLILKSK